MQTSIDTIDSINVLVIEDNQDDAEILENNLLQISRKKMKLVFCESLKLGLSALTTGCTDIVFLDLSLPDNNGLEAIVQIRKIAPVIPIIVLTGRDDYGLSLQSLRMGAQDYLLKGELNPSALERSIDYARERQRGADVSEFLASLVKSSVDAIIACSLDGKIVSWNSGAEKMYGYKAPEVIGQSLEIIVPKERLKEWTEILKRTKSDLTVDRIETVRVRKDGSTLPVSSSVSPLRNLEDLPTGAVIVARDTTSRLLAEKDLRESNQRLMLAVQAAKVGIWSWDIQAGTIIWDARMCAFFGRPEEDFPQKNNEFMDISLDTFMQIVHDEDREKVSEALTQALEQNSNYECSYRIVWPDSSMHFIEASGVLTFNPEGGRSRMIGICLDVTERKTMERSIREINRQREQIASAIVEHAPVGIVTLDAGLNITDVNRAFATMTRTPIKELLCKQLVTVLPEQIYQKAQISMETGSSCQFFRHKIGLTERYSERSHYWDISFWPLLSSKGLTTGAILQVADCTSAVMLEEQREDFVVAVAHDIKNPLIGAARLLNHLCSQTEEEAAQNNHEMLSILRDSNDRLLKLVQNLVDVHQYETLGYPVVYAEVNLHDTMTSCIKQNKYFSESRKVDIHLISENSAPIIISADCIGLSRVFMNLLHNAIKFSHPGSSVEVAIKRLDLSYVEISVSDSGEGINIAEQKNLFHRYAQAEAGKLKANSTGLGLYLSRQIIQGHHGRIGCKSKVGIGSTFFIRLPVNQQANSTNNEQLKGSEI